MRTRAIVLSGGDRGAPGRRPPAADRGRNHARRLLRDASSHRAVWVRRVRRPNARAAAASSDDRAAAVVMAGVTTYDIVVIGAGFAGLSAAVRLTQAGARVLVLEARGRLRGRATAFPDRETGELVDNGQHILLGCYTETLEFLRAVGAEDRVRLQSQLAVTMIDREGRRSRLACPSLPPPLHLLAGVLDWDGLPLKDRFSVIGLAGPIRIARRELAGDRSATAPSPRHTLAHCLI